jgi:hypothetical protein
LREQDDKLREQDDRLREQDDRLRELSLNCTPLLTHKNR